MIDDTETPDPVIETAETSQASDIEAFSNGAEAAAPVSETPKPDAAPVADVPPVATPDAKPEPTPEEKAVTDAKTADDAEIKLLGIKSEKTAARFRELNSEARKVPELTKQIETFQPLAEQAERFNAIIADTKANADQIGIALHCLKQINSGDLVQRRAALKTLSEQAAGLAKELGEPIQGVDPVTGHADLNEQIENGVITREAALELARARAVNSQQERIRTSQTDQQQREQEFNTTLDTAVANLNAVGVRLKSSDSQYQAKLDTMQKSGTIEMMKENVHPSRWVESFQKAYSKIAVEPARPAPGAMPLRPTGADSSAMKREPKNDLEAFEMGAASVR